MERRDFDYYEARSRDVKLEDITSDEGNNAEILQRLRDQELYAISITDDYVDNGCFIVGEDDDLGWLGYFIGKSKYLEKLRIFSWGEGGNIEAFMEGINHNQSITRLHIDTNLGGLCFRNLRPFFRNNHNRLAELELNNFEVGLECAQSIAFVLGESQYYSLTTLRIEACNLSDEGFAGIATALRIQPQLESLHLEGNNIGLMGCIALGNSIRGWETSNLKTLDLDGNDIDDQVLEVLATAMANTALKTLFLSDNLITGAGLMSMSDYFQSGSCCLKSLYLDRVNFGDEGAVVLAGALMGNKSLTSLRFHPDHAGITDVGWAAFSKLLCDPSSINNTYLSNHNIEKIWGYQSNNNPHDITLFLRFNHLSRHPREAAIWKILESHPDLDMNPFFQWKLKLLPVVANWFRSARSCLFPDRPRSTQRQSLQNRELSALYKFVRGMPSLAVTSFWQQFTVNAQAKRRRIDNVMRRLEDERQRLEDERRRLEDERQRLGGARCKLDYDEEAAWVRLGGRPTGEGEGSSDFVSGGAKRRRQE
eukprot:scaffold23977_cov123-Skeletonema_dohrnii-CCMP3373.AAC.1